MGARGEVREGKCRCACVLCVLVRDGEVCSFGRSGGPALSCVELLWETQAQDRRAKTLSACLRLEIFAPIAAKSAFFFAGERSLESLGFTAPGW